MSRKAFIESHGATCRNWNWSWSFINEADRTIIFGAWDQWDDGQSALILSENWQRTRKGRKSSGYPQSREHIRHIEEAGYRLLTFPMKYSEQRLESDGTGPSTIAGFERVLTEKRLFRRGHEWYAEDPAAQQPLPEELPAHQTYTEGAAKQVTINAYERSVEARLACIRIHGCSCAVYGFNFAHRFGPLGEGYIHVHHRVPMAARSAEYEVNPQTDLVPVCPNCHAMLHHKRDTPLEVEALRRLLHPHPAAA